MKPAVGLLGLFFVMMTLGSYLTLLNAPPLEPTPVVHRVIEVQVLPGKLPTQEMGAEGNKVRKLNLLFASHGTATPIATVGNFTAVLTCKHCTAKVATSLDTGELVVRSEAHPTLDVALVWVAGKLPTLRLRPEFAEGDLVSPIGYPGYYDRYRSHGYVCGPRGDMHMTSAAVWYGMSGGPVLDQSGAVIGIVAELDVNLEPGKATPQVSFFVPYASFRDWLNEALSRVPGR